MQRIVESRKHDKRGSARDRHISKLWLLAAYGDGVKCECVHCSCELTFSTVTRDRIQPGGRYVRSNIQPSCLGCNVRRGNNRKWVGSNPSGRKPNRKAHINPQFLVRGGSLHPELT